MWMIILVGLLAALTLIVAILESRKPTEPDTPVAPLENPTVTPDVIKTVIDELFAMLENSLAGRPLLLFALEAIRHLAESMIPSLATKLSAK